MSNIIEIDGSFKEAGGQILRTALGLSALTEKPFHMIKIRAGRKNPGIKTQHLEAVRAVAAICDADLKGASIGSSELTFRPKEIAGGDIDISIPTAGSIGLALQGVMIAALGSPAELKIKIEGGATHGKWAAPLPYIQHVLLPLLSKMNYHAELEIERFGYYPKGGARSLMKIKPARIRPIHLTEQGDVKNISGVSNAERSLQKARVADRQASAAEEELRRELAVRAEIDKKYVDASNPGSGIDLWAELGDSVIGAGALGERGKRAETVGLEAAQDLVKEIQSGAPIDSHAADQLLPYIALATPSAIKVPRITGHCETNIWLIEKFLPVRFEVDETVITCRAA